MNVGDGAAGTNVRHLYVHLPFCSHRCGYCDFVTVVGRGDQHGAYVDALLVELGRERTALAGTVTTVFVGGGTPSFTDPHALRRVLEALPAAAEITVEANPETVTSELAVLLQEGGVTPRLTRRSILRTSPSRGPRARCHTGRRPPCLSYSS